MTNIEGSLDPATGMSVWFRDHADPHMAVLMDPDGPFAAADANTETNHARKGQPLPYQAPGLYFQRCNSYPGGNQ